MEWNYNCLLKKNKSAVNALKIEDLCEKIEHIAEYSYMSYFSPGSGTYCHFLLHYYDPKDQLNLNAVWQYAIGDYPEDIMERTEHYHPCFIRRKSKRGDNTLRLNEDFRLTVYIPSDFHVIGKSAEKFEKLFKQNLRTALLATDYVITVD